MITRRKKMVAMLLSVLMAFAAIVTGTFSDQDVYADSDSRLSQICFDGDSSYDWAHFYYVDSQDTTITDLNITVLDETGAAISPDLYDLTISMRWWDDALGQDASQEVSSPYRIAAKDAKEGFTEFAATATMKGTGNSLEATFFIMDIHSLCWLCPEIEFPYYTSGGEWRMCERFWVALETLQPPVVKVGGTKILKEGKDYTVDYYTRSGDLDSMETDRDQVLAGVEKLPGIPTKTGEYIVKINGIGEYYGENIILLDVEGIDDPDPVPDFPIPVITGWIQDNGGWQYADENGMLVSGWVSIDRKWYYFDDQFWMTTGWQKLGGKWYYLAPSGAMVTGWKKLSGKWYYFAGSGAMVSGWKKLSGKWYYFAGGAMATGWKKLSGKWYYFGTSGAMYANQWQGNYYLGADGALVE